MKSAIIIRDGRTQVVLTPETDVEKMALDTIEGATGNTFRGELSARYDGGDSHRKSESSLIFVVDKE